MVSPQGPCDSLGISVAGGVGSPHGNTSLFIAAMDTNGLAAKTQQLQVGSACVFASVLCAHYIVGTNIRSSNLTIYFRFILGQDLALELNIQL